MSKPIEIESLRQFREILAGAKIAVIADFYTEQSNKQFGPLIDTLARTAPGGFIFVKINAQRSQEITALYKVTPPRVLIIRDGNVLQSLSVSDVEGLSNFLKLPKPAAGGESSGSTSGSAGPNWLGADLPRGYKDVTDQIEHRRLDLLNVDSEKGSVRVLFSPDKPSALSNGKGTETDWLESDTDEQLLLFMPFQSVLKLHTLQITSIPPSGDDVDEDEVPMRPKTIKLYSNRPNNLGFDQAESTSATQEIEIPEKSWNANGTANIPLRFVKFQNLNSLVIFVVDGDGSSQKVRLDRLRLIGESGEKREMGKLEKIGDELGE